MLTMLLAGCVHPGAGGKLSDSPSGDAASADSPASNTDSPTDSHSDSCIDSGCHPGFPPAYLAIPAYFYPDLGQPGSLWDEAMAVPEGPRVLVFNPNSGPGAAQDPAYLNMATTATNQGDITLLAYVSTSYGARDPNAVLADIASYAAWYPVSGFFFDEAPGVETCDAAYAQYAAFADAARLGVPGAFIALNPGADTCDDYAEFADLLLTFEGDAATYATHTTAMTASPDHIWHLVYDAPEDSSGHAMFAAVDEARANGAGWLYVTDDTLPNPWDTLPAYLDDEATEASALAE